MANGEPISSGRMAVSNSISSEAISRASGLPGPTISPSIEAMSSPRPYAWLEIEPPAVNFEWSLHMQDTTILWSSLSLVSTPTIRGSILPALMSATPTSSSTTFLFSSSAAASAFALPPLPSWPSVEGSGGADGSAAGAAGAAGSATGGGRGRRRGCRGLTGRRRCRGLRLRPALRRRELDRPGRQLRVARRAG